MKTTEKKYVVMFNAGYVDEEQISEHWGPTQAYEKAARMAATMDEDRDCFYSVMKRLDDGTLTTEF